MGKDEKWSFWPTEELKRRRESAQAMGDEVLVRGNSMEYGTVIAPIDFASGVPHYWDGSLEKQDAFETCNCTSDSHTNCFIPSHVSILLHCQTTSRFLSLLEGTRTKPRLVALYPCAMGFVEQRPRAPGARWLVTAWKDGESG